MKNPTLPNANPLYWQRLDQLVASCKLVIDRPGGTPHPRYPDFIYPLDYGYLEGTLAMDGGGIDVWRGTLVHPAHPLYVTGIVCTIDLEKQDAELKILVNCTQAEAQTILATHNEGPQSGLLILRPDGIDPTTP